MVVPEIFSAVLPTMGNFSFLWGYLDLPLCSLLYLPVPLSFSHTSSNNPPVNPRHGCRGSMGVVVTSLKPTVKVQNSALP